MTAVCIPEDEERALVDQAVDKTLDRVRSELGDIAHPFSIEIVGDGVRTHFRLEHRPVDLKSVTIDLVDLGVPAIDEEAPEEPPRPVYSYMVGDFDDRFSHEFLTERVYIEDTGAELPFEPVRQWRASQMKRSDFDDGSNFFQIALGVYIDVPAGQIVFDEPPAPGAMFRIEGRKFRYFTDVEYARFIETASAMIGHNRTNSTGGPWGLSDLTPVEEYPLAVLASIQALWALATDASFDIDILAPDGVNIPRSERFRQLMEMIGARQTQYDEMAAALNIGIGRLETYTVRRVAKLTNRLVPVYLSREFDDWSKPKRVLLPQNLLGTTPVTTIVGKLDIDMYSGYPWHTVVDLNCDISKEIQVKYRRDISPFSDAFDRAFLPVWEEYFQTEIASRWTPEAVVRKNRGAPHGPPLRTIKCEVLDPTKGLVLMSLTANDTRRLPYNAFWELQLRPDDGGEPLPVLAGMIRTSISEVVR
jgi:hypothetical protein